MFVRSAGVTACVIAAAATASFGGPVVMHLNSIYNGDAIPAAGIGPGGAWGRATFTDVAQGQVQLKLEALFDNNGADGWRSEKITTWYFNFSPDTSVSSLNFGTLPQGWSVATGTDDYPAPGDGRFDFRFSMPTAANKAFDRDDSVTINITGAGITAQSFNGLSEPVPGGRPHGFLHAAHIQAIAPTGQSSHATQGQERAPVAPLPGAAAMAFVGLGAVMSRRSRS